MRRSCSTSVEGDIKTLHVVCEIHSLVSLRFSLQNTKGEYIQVVACTAPCLSNENVDTCDMARGTWHVTPAALCLVTVHDTATRGSRGIISFHNPVSDSGSFTQGRQGSEFTCPQSPLLCCGCVQGGVVMVLRLERLWSWGAEIPQRSTAH